MAIGNTCIVCGRYSQRAVWNNTFVSGGQTYVACDFHSIVEFQSSVQLTAAVVGAGGVINQDPAITEAPNT